MEEEKITEEEDYKEKYFRQLAEIENTRKRMQREKQEMTRFAIDQILSEILIPIETLENALGFAEQMSEETKNWAIGFQMILAQFKEVLNSHGVVAYSSVGESFDPRKHDAVEMEESEEHPSGTILQEFQKGYKCGERILRPARVKVAKEVIKESL